MEPKKKKQFELRRARIKELMLQCLRASEMVTVLRIEGLVPSSEKPEPKDEAEQQRRDDADYRLIRKDINAITTQLENAPDRDAVRIAKSAREVYKGRLEKILRSAFLTIDNNLAAPVLRAAALRAAIDTSTRLAVIDGVVTEPKAQVEMSGDALIRSVFEKFVAKQQESARREKEEMAQEREIAREASGQERPALSAADSQSTEDS